MKKLYKVRLYQVGYYYYLDHNYYEVSHIGTIVAYKKRKNCKEFLYGVDIPIVENGLSSYFDAEEDMHNDIIRLSEAEKKVGYIVLKDDFNEKNVLNKKDLLKFNYDCYASMSMKIKQYEDAQVKRLFKTKNGVVYGKNIGRS